MSNPILPRKLQYLFGSAYQGSPSGALAVFGSLQAGSPAFTADPEVIQSLTNWTNALHGAMLQSSANPSALNSPTFQDLNSLFFVLSYGLIALYQQGIAPYDAGENYDIYALAKDSSGNLYVSQQTNNLGNALTATAWWLPYAQTLSGPNIVKAWVNFNGYGGATINTSFNVAGVTRIAAGHYRITFTNPMADGNYAFSGTTGTPNGVSSVNGDNLTICGCGAGGGSTTGVKTTGYFDVYTWSSAAQASSDSQDISIMVFGN